MSAQTETKETFQRVFTIKMDGDKDVAVTTEKDIEIVWRNKKCRHRKNIGLADTSGKIAYKWCVDCGAFKSVTLPRWVKWGDDGKALYAAIKKQRKAKKGK